MIIGKELMEDLEHITSELWAAYRVLAAFTKDNGGVVMYGQVGENIAHPREEIYEGIDRLETMVIRLRKGGE